jgi:hypothetical protein
MRLLGIRTIVVDVDVCLGQSNQNPLASDLLVRLTCSLIVSNC